MKNSFSKGSKMAKQGKPNRFNYQRGRQLTIKRRLAQNNRIPIANRITDDKVVDGLLADAKRKRKKRKRK